MALQYVRCSFGSFLAEGPFLATSESSFFFPVRGSFCVRSYLVWSEWRPTTWRRSSSSSFCSSLPLLLHPTCGLKVPLTFLSLVMIFSKQPAVGWSSTKGTSSQGGSFKGSNLVCSLGIWIVLVCLPPHAIKDQKKSGGAKYLVLIFMISLELCININSPFPSDAF